MQWTLAELADVRGVTKRQVQKWTREGLPVQPKKRGNAILVDSVEATDWLIDRAVDQARKVKLKDPDNIDWSSEKRKIEVLQMRGELLDAEDIRRTWDDMVGTVRKMIMSIPNRCAALVAHKDETDARLALDSEVKSILKEAKQHDDKRREGIRDAG